jgi:hypothetical protein
MDIKLRDDIAVIILQEAFGMLESYARRLATHREHAREPRFREADEQALDAVDHILTRIDSRCSKIEG